MQKRWTLGPIVILAKINPFNLFRWIETDGLCVDCLERGSWQAVTSGFELSAGAKFKFKIALKFPISTANRAAEVKMIHERRIFGTFDWALAWFDSKFYHRFQTIVLCPHYWREIWSAKNIWSVKISIFCQKVLDSGENVADTEQTNSWDIVEE